MAATGAPTPVGSASRPDGWSALAAPLACGACLAIGAAYVASGEPGESRVSIPCPYFTLTGLWCPGCGLTRATHHLLRGDLAQALRFNAFIPVVLLTIVTAWALWVWRALPRRAPSSEPRRTLPAAYRARLIGLAITALLAFGVIRNLPGFEMLRG